MSAAAVSRPGVQHVSIESTAEKKPSLLESIKPGNDTFYSKIESDRFGGFRMRSLNPFKSHPKLTSIIGLLFTAGVATGAGMLIRDALGSQEWCNAIKDGLTHAAVETKHFFTEGPGAVMGSTPAIASYLGIAGFIAGVYNIVVFSRGLRVHGATPQQQFIRGLKTVVSGAAAGAAFGAMAGELGAGAGMAAGAIIGAGVGAGVGLIQALIMLINSKMR